MIPSPSPCPQLQALERKSDFPGGALSFPFASRSLQSSSSSSDSCTHFAGWRGMGSEEPSVSWQPHTSGKWWPSSLGWGVSAHSRLGLCLLPSPAVTGASPPLTIFINCPGQAPPRAASEEGRSRGRVGA